MASHGTQSRALSGKLQPEGPVPAALTFMYLLKMAWISSLMLGCRTARSRSMDTAGSVKLKVQSQGGARPPARSALSQPGPGQLFALPPAATARTWCSSGSAGRAAAPAGA